MLRGARQRGMRRGAREHWRYVVRVNVGCDLVGVNMGPTVRNERKTKFGEVKHNF